MALHRFPKSMKREIQEDYCMYRVLEIRCEYIAKQRSVSVFLILVGIVVLIQSITVGLVHTADLFAWAFGALVTGIIVYIIQAREYKRRRIEQLSVENKARQYGVHFSALRLTDYAYSGVTEDGHSVPIYSDDSYE